jgi:muramoyltetrapeptide carboxypeptidase
MRVQAGEPVCTKTATGETSVCAKLAIRGSAKNALRDPLGYGAMIRRPPRLRPGDRVRVISLSGSFPRSTWASARAFAEPLGLRCSFGKSLYRDPGYLGRDPRRRADDFNEAVRDDGVRAILLFRGGNSAAETLPHLDLDALARRPKVVAGYSDHSSIVLAVRARARLVSFLVPPMLLERPRARSLSVESFRRLAMEGASGLAMPPATGERWRAGRARGPLVAGNLAVLRNLLGTPYLPSLDGALLAWEEIGESVQDVNAMLTQLANTGALARLAGMVVGHLEGVPRSEAGVTLRTLVLARAAGVPVYKTRAFGHFRPCFTLPLGVRASLDDGLVLDEPAVD